MGLKFHKTEDTTLVATSESTWKTGYVFTINRHEDFSNKNKPYWTVRLQSVRRDKAIVQDFVQTFQQQWKAKHFCNWLNDGYSFGFITAMDSRIPVFKNGQDDESTQ